MTSGIPDDVFYGKPTSRQIQLRKKLEENSTLSALSYDLPYRLKRPFGPSKCWKIFRKQDQALSFQKTSYYHLITMAFQYNLGERLFLVAHPAIFWFYDTKRQVKDRSTYEIIPENAVCKLYFDLEFDKEINPDHNGFEMTAIFIQIVNHFLFSKWHLNLKKENVLNLDSSNHIKFSKHLIYQIPNVLFKDNYHVGYFIKEICQELYRFYHSDSKHFYKFKREEILKLFIQDKKKNIKLFCDEGVYTKNRHFRLFGSSKLGKNTPLKLGSDNFYKPIIGEEKVPIEERFFIDSLITFVENKDQQIIEVSDYKLKKNYSKSDHLSSNLISNSREVSPFPIIDEFIQKNIYNGKIYRWYFFSSERVLVYDIIGYRFCGNIGRQHKSNNIKFIVNINEGIYYQKCYDPDCSSYRSSNFPLPNKVRFLLEDDSWLNDISNNTENENIQLGYFEVTNSYVTDIINKENKEDIDLSEKDLMEIADVLESIDQIENDK